MKVFVISQPKSGTYLCANLLQEFGLIFPGIHFNAKNYQHYDLNNIEECRKDPKKYTHIVDLDQSVKLIKENEFGVGHISHNTRHENILQDFKKVLLIRDVEEIKQSAKRWTEIKPAFQIKEQRLINILNWQKNNIFVLNFKNIIENNIEVIDDLQIYLFGEIKIDSSLAINNALKADSLTKSKIRN